MKPKSYKGVFGSSSTFPSINICVFLSIEDFFFFIYLAVADQQPKAAYQLFQKVSFDDHNMQFDLRYFHLCGKYANFPVS